jgi:hypothetical protein
MDGHCETCRWWGIPADRDDDDIYHYEGAIPEGWRMCLRTEREHWRHEPPAGVRLAVAGYEFDGLATAPDFGCVQYEPKRDTGDITS